MKNGAVRYPLSVAEFERGGPVVTGKREPPGTKPDLLVFSPDLGTLATLAVLFGQRAAVRTASSQVAAISLLAATAPALTIIELANAPSAALSVLQIVSARHARSPTIVIAPEELWLGGFATSGYQGLRVVLSPPPRLEDLLKAISATGVLAPLALAPSVLAALDFIRSEYARSLRSRELARKVSVSFSHLAHLFRSELGLSSREYLAKIRVHVARDLLRESSCKLDHIAELTGFSDASHLSRAFSTAFGQRPGRYRSTLGLGFAASSGSRPREEPPGARSHDWKLRGCG
jgi:transcriptional regulator GlxA family with amidase domain